MSELIKISGPAGEPRASVLLVHGLGGHHYDTWRRGEASQAWDADPTFWPNWLARDCEGVAVYSIGYDAPVSRWRGMAMHPASQATTILERLLVEPALASGPLILIGHSLGGLIIKQLLRTADSIAQHRPVAADLLSRVHKVAFLATPHTGADLTRWGARLRILVRPSLATACLRRNDANLRDLNYWYREWANPRDVDHLILTEAQDTRILGMIVKPDSGDPGLKVRPVDIAADHSGICKPLDDSSYFYVFVRGFVARPTAQPRSPIERQIAALEDRLLAKLDERGDIARAAESGLERQTILELARRLKPDETLDLDQAIAALTNAIDIALATITRGERASNQTEFVNDVLARVAAQTKAGYFDQAAKELDGALVELDTHEVEQREVMTRSRVALLEAGIEQDILRRDAKAVARLVERLVAIEHPDDRAQRFAALRRRQDVYDVEGGDKGINFSLEIAIEIARLAVQTAQGPDQRSEVRNDLAIALWRLGSRESGTARLVEAVEAYRAALEERTRERVPLGWAMTQNNLGVALQSLGERESGTARLTEAVEAYRAALTEYTRERVPLDWAMTQNNLGNALARLGARASGTARFTEAVEVFRAALTERTR